MLDADETATSISDTLRDYWDSFVDNLPSLITALVVLVVGLIVAGIIAAVVRKLLGLIEKDKHVSGFLHKWGLNVKASGFVGKFVWWLVFLVFLSASVEILGVGVLTESINSLVAFMPSLFAAAVVAAITFAGARVVKGLIASMLEGVGSHAANPVSSAASVIVMVFGFTLALAQLGIDTTILNANITVIVGGIMLAFALAFGLGGREVAGKILEKAYENSKTSKKSK